MPRYSWDPALRPSQIVRSMRGNPVIRLKHCPTRLTQPHCQVPSTKFLELYRERFERTEGSYPPLRDRYSRAVAWHPYRWDSSRVELPIASRPQSNSPDYSS